MEFVPTGTIEGVLSSFGLYEECLSIASPNVKWNGIRGKYCLAKVHLPFLNPAFPEPYDLELDAKPDAPIDLNRLSAYAKKKALLEHLNVDFDILNNKLKLLQMINMLNGSHYRVGLCFPSSCTSFELGRAFNKCKCSLVPHVPLYFSNNRLTSCCQQLVEHKPQWVSLIISKSSLT